MNRSVTAPGLITIDRIWSAESAVDRATRSLVLLTIGTFLLWVAAKIQVPFWPVHATMQSFVVVLLGAFYGSRLGAATVIAYLIEGLAGLPVFSGTPEAGIGFAYIIGPTGGYLAGFVLAAFITGALVERGWGKSVISMISAALIANVVLYALGLAWLGHLIGAQKAVSLGLAPFILIDLVKILVAAAFTVGITKVTGR